MADPTDYAIVANENYVSPTYEPPQAFLNVGSALENIVTDRDHGSGDAAPNSILAFVAGDRAEQVEYIEGFVGIGIFLSCMVSIWFLVLLLLKFQGRDRVGCAAGFAFHDADSDTQSAKEERKTRGGASGTLFRGDGQDASVGAAVGADDSIAMDEPEVRKKKASEIEKQERKSSSGIFASVFGRSRDASGNEPRSEPSSPQHKGVVATFKGGRNGRNWSVLRDDTTDYPNPPDSNGNNDNNDNNDNNGYNYDNDENYVPYELEEIELHMELDDIVHSATRASEKKEQKRRNKGKPWSLRSLPPKTVVLENDSNEDDLSIETKLAERENNKACGQTPCCSFDAKDVARRRVATRWVFAVFALISLICCILLITHMYVPLESAALTSKEVVRETSEIVDELNEVLEIVDEAATVTESLLKNTPLEYESLCPGFAVGNFASQFGFNPKTVIDTVVQEYINYIPTIRGLLDTAKETGASVTDVLMDVNSGVNNTNEYLWIIPLIICVTILIIFSQLALMAAVVSREQRFKDLQPDAPRGIEDCYGWTVLPLQVLVVLVSWLLVILCCFGIVITTDSCIPSLGAMESANANIAIDSLTNGRGTPEDTIMAIIDQYMEIEERQNDPTFSLIDDLAYQRLSSYITGCRENPLQELIVVQRLLQDSLNYVTTQSSFASNVLGLGFIENQCGPDNQVKLFFENLGVLNGQLSSVNKAMLQAYDAVACPRVNALYVEAVHGALCTDFATASTNGLLLLAVISFSGMVLITLRASWRTSVF